MTRTPTPSGGIGAYADQAAYDALQDARVRRVRRGVAVAVTLAALALAVALAAHLRRPSQASPPPAPVVHCPAAPAATCAPTLTCAACPACPQLPERRYRR